MALAASADFVPGGTKSATELEAHGGFGRAKLPLVGEPPPRRGEISLERMGFPGIDLDGAADRDVPEYYVGVEIGDTGQTDIASTLELFEQLAQRMNGNAHPVGDPVFENRNIPAGYTYLAQFAAHDLTINSEDRIDLLSEASGENLQARPLVLDTLHGNGPMISSFCHEGAAGCIRQVDPQDVVHPPRNTRQCLAVAIGIAISNKEACLRGTG